MTDGAFRVLRLPRSETRQISVFFSTDPMAFPVRICDTQVLKSATTDRKAIDLSIEELESIIAFVTAEQARKEIKQCA